MEQASLVTQLLQKVTTKGLLIVIVILFTVGSLVVTYQYVKILKQDNTIVKLEKDLNIANDKIILKDSLMEANKVDYENKIKEVESSFKEISKKYSRSLKDIQEFKGKPNENDCNNSKLLFDTFKY